MNTTSKILVIALTLALGACDVSSQADVDKAARDRAADVAKARQDAQPAVDAANREMAKTQQQAEANVADAYATADKQIDQAAVDLSRKQAKADYDIGMAAADGDLSVALEKCKMLTGDAKDACSDEARAAYYKLVDSLKAKLAAAEKQAN